LWGQVWDLLQSEVYDDLEQEKEQST